MRFTKACIFFAAAYCVLSLLAGQASASSQHVIHAYYSKAGTWCGVQNLETYKSRVHSNSASTSSDEIVYDNVTFYFNGSELAKIVHWTTTVDFEVELTSTYYLNPKGMIHGAKVNRHPNSCDCGPEQTDKYEVRDGKYTRSNNLQLKAVEFPKVASWSELPYAKLISRYQSAWTADEICE